MMPWSDTPCEEWAGRRNEKGYGTRDRNTGTILAHRQTYEAANGPVPAGLEIDHLCENRACVNPAHMEAVTHAENVRRSYERKPRSACRWGHPFNAENTYQTPDGRRQCRVCHRERQARYLGKAA